MGHRHVSSNEIHAQTGMQIILLLIGAVLIALCAVLVNWGRISTVQSQVDRLVPVHDADCADPAVLCTEGTHVVASDGTQVCDPPRPAKIGSTCTSPCCITDAEATCNGQQECVCDDEDCEGYCVIDQDLAFTIYQEDAPGCEDKFAFKAFFKPNVTAASSSEQTQWSRYTDFPFLCSAQGGCTAYATEILLFTDSTANTSWDQPFPGFVGTCANYLNMTTASACIRSEEIMLDSAIATPLFRALLGQWNPLVNWTTVTFVGRACVFQYKCGITNTSAYLDPQYLKAKKRQISFDDPLKSPQQLYVEHHLGNVQNLIQEHEQNMKAHMLPAFEKQRENLHAQATTERGD